MPKKFDENDFSPWYKKGLQFSCTECGQCCTGSPGYTWVTEDEIANMTDHLGMSMNSFASQYLRKIGDRWSLRERIDVAGDYDCVFLKDKKCQIYSVRPLQCRTFPWWPQNLTSQKEWEETARRCEGIQQNAELVPFQTIEQNRSQMQ